MTTLTSWPAGPQAPDSADISPRLAPTWPT